jgi:large subunit ribosomal protein L4
VSHAPKPRSYRQRTPKKMIRLALASALSDRRADGKVVVLDSWGIDTPSTKAALEVLGHLGVEGRVLVVLGRDDGDVPVWKSLRNVQHVHVLSPGELNAYDVLVSDWVIFTRDSLPGTKASEES